MSSELLISDPEPVADRAPEAGPPAGRTPDRRTAGIEVPRVLGRLQGRKPGPTLILVGGLHGNEPAGVLALQRMFADPGRRSQGSRPRTRRRPGGQPQGPGGETALPGQRPQSLLGSRARRAPARQLRSRWPTRTRSSGISTGRSSGRGARPRVRSSSSTSTPPRVPGFPSPPSTTTCANRRLAFEFPVPVVLGLEEELADTLTTYVESRGLVTAGFESGQHDDPESVERAEMAIWIALEACGLVRRGSREEVARARRDLARVAGSLPHVVEVRHRHPVLAGDRFRMDPDWVNFQLIAQGQLEVDPVGVHRRQGPDGGGVPRRRGAGSIRHRGQVAARPATSSRLTRPQAAGAIQTAISAGRPTRGRRAARTSSGDQPLGLDVGGQGIGELLFETENHRHRKLEGHRRFRRLSSRVAKGSGDPRWCGGQQEDRTLGLAPRARCSQSSPSAPRPRRPAAPSSGAGARRARGAIEVVGQVARRQGLAVARQGDVSIRGRDPWDRRPGWRISAAAPAPAGSLPWRPPTRMRVRTGLSGRFWTSQDPRHLDAGGPSVPGSGLPGPAGRRPGFRGSVHVGSEIRSSLDNRSSDTALPGGPPPRTV